jgi:hypothetical protein
MSQPAREYLCKITELGFFAADFILGHIILFIMLPALCVPYIDKFHSVMLFWLRPRYVVSITKSCSVTDFCTAVKSAHQSTRSSSRVFDVDVSFDTLCSTSRCWCCSLS